jgi:hypothetical protein
VVCIPMSPSRLDYGQPECSAQPQEGCHHLFRCWVGCWNAKSSHLPWWALCGFFPGLGPGNYWMLFSRAICGKMEKWPCWQPTGINGNPEVDHYLRDVNCQSFYSMIPVCYIPFALDMVLLAEGWRGCIGWLRRKSTLGNVVKK